MSSQTSHPVVAAVAAGERASRWRTRLPLWSAWFDRAIFFLLALFAILLPHSIKGAQHAWRIAFALWIARLLGERRRPFPQPLCLPLLAYVVLSGISTALSPEPYLSWDRMKIVGMVLVGVLFAQNLKRLSQVRILVALVLLSGFAAAVFTGWQYTYGIGVELRDLDPATPLYAAGLRPGDIITDINGHAVHSLSRLQQLIAESPTRTPMQLKYVRWFPQQHLETVASREQFVASGYATAKLPLVLGKPIRAQGTLGHYVVFAEMLMQLGCLAWAMLLYSTSSGRWLQVACGVIFVAITGALVLTETRAALFGLGVGCFLALLLLTRRRTRIAASVALLILVAAAAVWILRSRGIAIMTSSDPGTQFRMLMWEDGLRLVRQHPWFGVGMETVRIHYLEWNIRGFSQFHVMSHFHSTPLQLAVERGLPALVAWLWFVVAYIVFLLRLVRNARGQSRFAATVAAAILGGFVAFNITSLVHYNLGEEPLVAALFFFFGLAVAMDRMLRTPGAVDVV